MTGPSRGRFSFEVNNECESLELVMERVSSLPLIASETGSLFSP
jgi:hypothetical protein